MDTIKLREKSAAMVLTQRDRKFSAEVAKVSAATQEHTLQKKPVLSLVKAEPEEDEPDLYAMMSLRDMPIDINVEDMF